MFFLNILMIVKQYYLKNKDEVLKFYNSVVYSSQFFQIIIVFTKDVSNK